MPVQRVLLESQAYMDAYLVKPASTQRGEREAQEGMSVSVSGISVCAIRDTLHEKRALSRTLSLRVSDREIRRTLHCG